LTPRKHQKILEFHILSRLSRFYPTKPFPMRNTPSDPFRKPKNQKIITLATSRFL